MAARFFVPASVSVSVPVEKSKAARPTLPGTLAPAGFQCSRPAIIRWMTRKRSPSRAKTTRLPSRRRPVTTRPLAAEIGGSNDRSTKGLASLTRSSRAPKTPTSWSRSGAGARSCTTSIPCPSTRSTSAGSASTSAGDCRRSTSSRRDWKRSEAKADRPRRSEMAKPEFVYVTYIATTPEKLWQALLDGEITRQYWGYRNVSDNWKAGSTWRHERAYDDSGMVALVGKGMEFNPPRRLVLTWGVPADAANEGKHSRVTFDIEPLSDTVRLTITHDQLEPGSE